MESAKHTCGEMGLDSSIDSAHLTSAKSLRLQQNQHGSSHGGPLGSPAMRRDTFDNIDAKKIPQIYMLQYFNLHQ